MLQLEDFAGVGEVELLEDGSAFAVDSAGLSFLAVSFEPSPDAVPVFDDPD